MVKWCKRCEKETDHAKNGYCRECSVRKSREYRKNNPDVIAAQAARRWERKTAEERAASVVKLREWGEKNKDRRKEYFKKYSVENKEKLNARSAQWVKDNPERQKERTKRYHAENPEKAGFRTKVRRDKLEKSQPKWADTAKLKDIYKEAAEMRDAGIDVEVDHIYPLQGELVSGLHCPENLQIIPAKLNRSKQNKYVP